LTSQDDHIETIIAKEPAWYRQMWPGAGRR
jgi:hypothetical protein